MLRHSPATGVATGKIGSKQRERPIQKYAGRSSIDRKTAPHLSDPNYLSKCDALSNEGVVKSVRTSLRRNKELRQVRDFSPSMLLYGALPLFRTNFHRCHALLSFLTSSLASPITVQPEFFQFPRRNVQLGISLSTDFRAFSSFRRETCESTSFSALIFTPFQEQEKVWRGLFIDYYNRVRPGIFVRCVVLFLSFFFSIPFVVFSKGKERRFSEGLLGEDHNRIAAGGLGGLSPRSALQHLLRLRLCRRLGVRPLQGSKQASNLQNKRRQSFVLDPSEISIFPSAKDSVPRQRGCAKDRSVRPGIFVRCVVFFRYRVLSFQKEKREGLARNSLVNITTVLLPGAWAG